MPVRVLLADDHQIFRQGLRTLLEREGLQLLGELFQALPGLMESLPEAVRPRVERVRTAPWEVSLEACREILRTCPGTKVILLTMHADEHQVVAALRAQIRGYVVKTQAAEEFLQAIQEVSRGGIYLSPSVSRVVVEAYLASRHLPPEPLTPRERQVLQLVAEGNTTKEIADLLGVTVKTAESYRTRIMEKLDIHQTAGLVRYAIRQGVIQP